MPYVIRLDDASEYMDIEKWNRFENILNKYEIKPLVGVIPDNLDPALTKYPKDEKFWAKVKKWQLKGYTIAMHGCEHFYITRNTGLHPVNDYSEFAGINIEAQKEKISKGISIFKQNEINPKVFFAPAHTFDDNTLEALRTETDIRIVSDTIAVDVYCYNGIYFVPQQMANIRKVPFRVATFCYHPNTMNDADFEMLDRQISKLKDRFISFEEVCLKNREFNIIDKLASNLIIMLRKFRRKL